MVTLIIVIVAVLAIGFGIGAWMTHDRAVEHATEAAVEVAAAALKSAHPIIGRELAYALEPARRIGTAVAVDGSGRVRIFREASGTFVRRSLDRVVEWKAA